MKKLNFVLVAIGIMLLVSSNAFAAGEQNVGANANINAAGQADGVIFIAPAAAGTTLTVTDGATVNDNGTNANAISNGTANNNRGTVTFAGDSTVKGDIGNSAANRAIQQINVNGVAGETVSFEKATGSTGNITTNNRLFFLNDSTVSLADGITFKQGVRSTAGTAGILILNGNSEVTGAGLAANPITEVQGGTAGGTAVLGGNFWATTASVIGTGTLHLKGDFTGTTINFASDGKVDINNSNTITADVTTAANNTGTLSIRGDLTLTGDVGAAGAALKLIEVGTNNANKTVAFSGDVFADTLNFVRNGNTVTIADNKNLNAAVTTDTNNQGTLTFNGTSTATGQIGTGSAMLKQVNVGAAGETVTFNNSVYAKDLHFTSTGTVDVADGANVGAVTNAANNQGTLNFLGATTSMGDIGTAGPVQRLTAVNYNGMTYLGHNVRAVTTTIGTTATVNLTDTLNVNGNLTLTGAGSVLNISSHTLNLNGTGIYTQNAGSLLQVSVNNSAAGQISANGNAVVNAGSALRVNVTSYLPSGTAYTIIDSAGGAGVAVPGTITSSSPLYSFAGTAVAGDLTVTATQANTLGGIASLAGAGAAGAGAALDSVATTGATGDMLDVINTLSSMGSEQAIADSIATMVPDISSGTMQTSRAIANMFFGSVSDRLGFARNGITQIGVSTGDMVHGLGFWFQELGSHIKQDTRKGVAGYQANTFGTAVGADKLITDNVRVGLAGGYGFADVNSKTAGSPSTDINSFQGMLYGSFDSLNLRKDEKVERGSKGGVRNPGEDSWYVDGMFGFTQDNYDSRRVISLPGDDRVVKADHYGQQYSTVFEFGYTFVFGWTKGLEITPLASLAYDHLYMNRYKEKGAEDLNLYVEGEGFNRLEQGLGGRFAYPLVCKKAGTFIPALKAAWFYDYMSDRFETRAEFAGGGPSFKSEGAKPARNGFLFGAEMAFLNKGNMTITANWDWEIRDQYSSHTYYGTVRFDF